MKIFIECHGKCKRNETPTTLEMVCVTILSIHSLGQIIYVDLCGICNVSYGFKISIVTSERLTFKKGYLNCIPVKTLDI